MKRASAFLFLICHACLLFATHERAGYITFRYISPLTYEATITTFTKASSTQVDRDTMTLDWGDGTIEKLLRTNGLIVGGVPQGVILANDLKWNIYISNPHTYPSPSCYVVSTTDPNRTTNIININIGASVSVQFHIEAYINATASSNCNNSGAQILAYPVIYGSLGDTFSYNPTFMDIDGDSLHVEPIPPLAEHDWAVPNYSYPDEVLPGINNSFSVNPLSGELSWISPQRAGIYSVAVGTSEFKNGVLSGYSVYDFQIIIEDGSITPPSFQPTGWTADANGNYSFNVNPGNTVQLNFSASADTLKALGEVFNSNHPATFSQTGTGSVIGSFSWIPDSSDSRPYPYITTFRASRHATYGEFERDLTALIYVSGGSRSTCSSALQCFTSVGEISSGKNSFTISPNPFSSSCRIVIKENIETGESLTLTLYDLNGKKVYSMKSTTNEFILPRKTLEQGLYLFKIYNNSGENLITSKVIVNDNF